LNTETGEGKMGEKKVADYVVEQLVAWGVKSVYGVAGDAILPLIDAISRRPDLTFFNVKHEATAAFMASAEAKLTGRLGVCAATSGPGIANLLNGLADAKSDQAPVLAITGQVDSFNISTNYKQYIDQSQLLSPAVSFSGIVVSQESCNDVLTKAMRSAVSQGTAVHVGFPRDLWSTVTEEEARPPEPYLSTKPVSPPEVITKAVELLNTAERPAILAGRGAKNQGKLLLALAEKWTAGVCHTMGAKGILPGDHHLVLGGLGEGGSAASTAMLFEADTILIAGATWWPASYVPPVAKIIQLDVVPENIGGGMPVHYGVVGDLADLLPAFTTGLTEQKRDQWLKRLHSLKTDWLKTISPEITTEGSPVLPGYLIKTLESQINEDAIITLDTGDHTVWFNRIFSGSSQEVIFSGKWRSMGFGIPAALSAQIAKPDRQVVAIVGDGGLAQTLAEFSTAVRYNLPITVVVMNNGYLAMEKDQMQLAGMNFEITALTNPDFAEYAELCGGRGFRVDSSEHLTDALRAALDSSTPSLVDVLTSAPIFPGAADHYRRKEAQMMVGDYL
jgi:pyruvate dehydrogenase (quinone)/pyruvate oxidase